MQKTHKIILSHLHPIQLRKVLSRDVELRTWLNTCNANNGRPTTSSHLNGDRGIAYIERVSWISALGHLHNAQWTGSEEERDGRPSRLVGTRSSSLRLSPKWARVAGHLGLLILVLFFADTCPCGRGWLAISPGRYSSSLSLSVGALRSAAEGSQNPPPCTAVSVKKRQIADDKFTFLLQFNSTVSFSAKVFLKDTDERACAYIADHAPNRWEFTFEGKNLLESVINFSTSGKILQYSDIFELFTFLYDRLNLGWYVISVTSTPEKVHKDVDTCKNVLRGLHNNQIAPRELDKARRTLLMPHEAEIKSNAYWLGLMAQLQSTSVPRKDISCIKDLTSLYEAATLEDVYVAYEHLKIDENS
ncbi:hypothetical protein ACS0TY_015771 [Phlomoides rotata]